jgi:hypothetical protein
LGGSEEAILVGSLNSLETKKILEGVTTATYVSGYLLFTRDQILMAQAFDTQKLELTGEAVPIAEHVAMNGTTGVPEFSAAENGTLVYQTGEAAGAWDLLWFGRDGKLIGPLAQQDRYFGPELSPDGGFLAYSLFNGNLGLSDIWTMDLKRGTKSRLTFGPGAHNSAVWSNDGRRVYYSSNHKGGIFHIYSKAADGSGSEQVVQEDPDAYEIVSCVSADGRYLVYIRRLVNDSKGNIDIWVLPLSGDGKPFPVVQSPFDDRNPRVSPNSKWMAYDNGESGRTEVYITSFPGGGARWQVSTNGGVQARWRGDGKELYFLDPSDNLMAVDVDVSSGTPRLGVPHALFQAVDVQRELGAYVVTNDGKKFLVNNGSTKQGSEPLTLVQNWTAELKK